ncbi:MAG: cation transporter [Proteobacteria bacterium]|nr:cation transporter [Pseudomonadota bacterium]
MSDLITEYHVEKMKCGGCVAKAQEVLASVSGFESAEFDLENKVGKVKGNVDPQSVCQALTEAGYPAVVKSA